MQVSTWMLAASCWHQLLLAVALLGVFASTPLSRPLALSASQQMLTIAMFIFTMALVGMFYPYNRGALLSACVVLYALTAGISG